MDIFPNEDSNEDSKSSLDGINPENEYALRTCTERTGGGAGQTPSVGSTST